ncbi:Hypothetical predicted protein, partial [Paramuricea clavata]
LVRINHQIIQCLNTINFVFPNRLHIAAVTHCKDNATSNGQQFYLIDYTNISFVMDNGAQPSATTENSDEFRFKFLHHELHHRLLLHRVLSNRIESCLQACQILRWIIDSLGDDFKVFRIVTWHYVTQRSRNRFLKLIDNGWGWFVTMKFMTVYLFERVYFGRRRRVYHTHYFSARVVLLTLLSVTTYQYNKNLTALILLDLSKAFDSVSHSILLHKLSCIGASPEAVEYFQDYLTGRSQYVRIGSTKSSARPIIHGVPQGAILSPLLFCIYINDLPGSIQSCNLDSYVDDSKLYKSFCIYDLELTTINLEADLQIAAKWCLEHQLLINPEKTKFLVVGSRPMLQNLKIWESIWIRTYPTTTTYLNSFRRSYIRVEKLLLERDTDEHKQNTHVNLKRHEK